MQYIAKTKSPVASKPSTKKSVGTGVAGAKPKPKFTYASSEEVMKIYKERFEGLRPLGKLMDEKL